MPQPLTFPRFVDTPINSPPPPPPKPKILYETLVSMYYNNTHSCTSPDTELHRDKRIARDNEYSDSEDEGEDPSVNKRRRNEHSINKVASKRPRITDDNNYQAKSVNGGKNNQKQTTISSPLPPEPSPITPLPQDEVPTSQNKSMHYVMF